MDKFLQKINNIRVKFKNFSSLIIASLFGNVISSIFWLFLASTMEAEQYGEINYFIAIASIGGAISFLGAGNTLVVFSAKEVKIQSPILIVTTIASIVSSLILFALFSNIVISIFVIGFVIFNHLLYETLGKKMYPTYAKYFVIQKILWIGFSLGLYFVIGPIGIVLGYGLSFFPFIFKMYKKYKISKKEFSLFKKKAHFMRDSYAHSLLTVLSIYTDKIIIAPLFGYSFLGNFQLSFQILMMLTMIPTIMYGYLLPQEASGKPYRKLWLMTILMVSILVIFTIILSPSILPILMPKYIPAIELIQIMSIAAIPMTITFRYTSKFLGNEKSLVVVIGQGIFVGLHVLGIFSLGTELGIQGVAISLVIAATAEALYFVIINRVLTKG